MNLFADLRRLLALLLIIAAGSAGGRDLDDIRRDGVLRHLGIPYANFVTGSGDGLDVELIRGFAEHLGVRYEFVPSSWQQVFGDLTGRHARRKGNGAERLDEAPVRGDLIANGMTVLDWRTEVVDFSEPTFPSGVWLVARADSSMAPIRPAEDLDADIAQVKALLPGRSVLALPNTCLDPGLYDMQATGAEVRLQPKERKLNEMVPAILNQDAESTLLDVPDALIALERWPGAIKVIGPISDHQTMAVGFRKDSPQLRAAFNAYLAQRRADGSYNALVRQYYPAVFRYYGEFFAASTTAHR
jgi:ABC-type amino acid transport substrate-binding protein